MGCDIHAHIEVKMHIENKEKWVCASLFSLNHYYDGKDKSEPYINAAPILYRDYTAFAQLAGVRKYNDNIETISEPRGIPEDVCDMVSSDVSRWGSDGHSHSYITLSELSKYRNTLKKTKYSGYITSEQYIELQKGVFPRLWRIIPGDKRLRKASWEKMEDPLIEVQNKLEDALWRELCTKNIELNGDDVRLVFWFDN